MPVLGCGAEMSKLMDVSDQDVQTIEDVIQERIGLGVSQPVAQRQAVAEALAQLNEERSMVMKAIDEQLGKPAANGPVVEEPAPVEKAAPAFARKQTETIEFKRWSGGAPLVELEAEHDYRSGQPVVVEALHGTTNAGLTKFSRGKANIESDFGAGFYASNTPSDVATNYANNDGPDLTSRVERLAERIEEDDEFEGDHGEALRMARAQLSESAPNTLKLFMRFKNPAVLGGRGETFFDYNESYDEETDEYGEPEGLLVDFINALDDAGDGLDIAMRDLEEVKAALFEAAQGEGVKFAGLISIVKEKAMDVSSVEDGSQGSSELLRQALEGMGFDGVIDTTVSNKFGPYKIVNGGRYSRGGGMKGMHEGTVHFIAFSPTQIKSATGNNGQFDPENPDIRFARKANPTTNLYSALAEEVGKINAKAQPADGWKQQIKGLVAKGAVKADEVEWTGLNDWLDLQQGKVTKEAVVEYLDANGVQVEEVTLGEKEDFLRMPGGAEYGDPAGAAKYSQYTLPGGENYREVLLTLPVASWDAVNAAKAAWGKAHNKAMQLFGDGVKGPELDAAMDEEEKALNKIKLEQSKVQKEYQSSHWDQPNVLAHIRVDDRVDADGNKILMVQEVQSDWGQEGKKRGFDSGPRDAKVHIEKDGNTFLVIRDGQAIVSTVNEQRANEVMARENAIKSTGIPAAPFVTKTDGWLNLALKRIITMAVQEGYDKVAFVNGEQSADRYDLSKQISQIKYEKTDSGGYEIEAYGIDGGERVLHEGDDESGISIERVEELVGKELAKKIANGEGAEDLYSGGYRNWRSLRGLDLKVGGEGMKAFYNQIVPAAVKKLVPKLGGELGMVQMNQTNGFEGNSRKAPAKAITSEQPGFTITDAMREKASQGLPMFARKQRKTEGKVFDRDVTGRVKLAVPRQLSELMPAKAWMRLMDKWYLTQPSEALRNELRKMKVDVQHSMDTAGELSAEVNKLSMAEREQVSDIIEKELKAGVTPAANAVRTADLMNQAFRTQTDELVRLGMLSQDAADRWRDKYIPRYYESKLPGAVKDTWASFVGKLSGQVRPLQGIKGKHLKGRGMVNTIPAADLAKWQAQGWEVRDKSYDPATSEQVMVWRDFTKEEREKMGEIRDAGFRFVLGYMQTQRDIAIGRMYERLANDPQWSSTTEKQDWLRVPDTTIPGTGALRYGKLAGRWVPKEVLSQLQTEHEMDSEAFALYKKALAYWKSNKTVMNPVSHLNNFVSNLTMAHFAGVSYWDAHKYGAAIRDFATGAPGLKAARDAGLFIGGLTDAELQNMMPAELRHMLGRTDSAGIKGLKVADAILTFGLRNGMSRAYEFGDKFFKYLIYQDAVKNGATPEEAVNHAQRYIFTYDDLPKGARRIRDFGVPFFAYTYKAIPALAHTAMAYPWRFAAPATIIGVANAIGYALAAGGDDDDWWESIKKYFSDAEFRKEADTLADEEYSKLPEWMKGHSAMGTKKQIRLGTDEVTGNPVFLDVSRFIPGGDLFDITGNAGGIPWLQPLTPNNPMLSIYSAMFANKEPFFGKDLVDKRTDDVWDAAGKRAKYLWQLATPAIAMGNATWDRLIGVAANKYGDELPYLPDALGGDITGVGKDGQPIQAKYAIPQSVGVKARPIDMEMSDSIDQAERRKTLSELEAQLRKARRANGNGVMSDRAFDKAEEKIRTKMDRVRDGLTIDGNEKD